jgi:hypothetical protein
MNHIAYIAQRRMRQQFEFAEPTGAGSAGRRRGPAWQSGLAALLRQLADRVAPSPAADVRGSRPG